MGHAVSEAEPISTALPTRIIFDSGGVQMARAGPREICAAPSSTQKERLR
jgi:hypothetical protein